MSRTEPDMKDIAKAAGVSTATVSRVLSGKGPAAEATKQKVLDAVDRLGYRLDDTARTLRTNRSRTIGALVFDLQNEPLIEFVRGAHRSASEHGYQLVVCDGQADPEVQRSNLDWLERHRVEGLLVAGSAIVGPERLRLVAERGTPVAPNHVQSTELAGEQRMLAERAASIEAFEHLQDFGHERLGVIVPGRDVSEGTDATFLSRVAVLREYLSGSGLSLPDENVAAVADAQSAVVELARLMAGPIAPTALVIGTVAVAPYVMQALAELEITVPDDISVVCYGESRWSTAMSPTMTTIRRDTANEGERFLVQLIEVIDGGSDVQADYTHELAEFVARESTGPSPTAGA